MKPYSLCISKAQLSQTPINLPRFPATFRLSRFISVSVSCGGFAGSLADCPLFSGCRSYDLRNRVESRRRWSNRTVFSDRADFVPQRRPAVLTLQPSVRSDTAQYRCRVDYQFSRTRYAHVNLTVIGKRTLEPYSSGKVRFLYSYLYDDRGAVHNKWPFWRVQRQKTFIGRQL